MITKEKTVDVEEYHKVTLVYRNQEYRVVECENGIEIEQMSGEDSPNE